MRMRLFGLVQLGEVVPIVMISASLLQSASASDGRTFLDSVRSGLGVRLIARNNIIGTTQGGSGSTILADPT